MKDNRRAGFTYRFTGVITTLGRKTFKKGDVIYVNDRNARAFEQSGRWERVVERKSGRKKKDTTEASE